MRAQQRFDILTVNSGSSSIKFSVYRMDRGEELVLAGSASGIGASSGRFHVSGTVSAEKNLSLPDHASALREINVWLAGTSFGPLIKAVGHRLVHGGREYSSPHVITPGLLSELIELVPFAPDHLPNEIDAIRSFVKSFPDIPHVAVFDTAFHRTMAGPARQYPLPEWLRSEGVVRYGFHGLSYESILFTLRHEMHEHAGRIIAAHLGNGASMAAIKNGASMDTTMGFTPAGGLVMSTRSGDLDPGVILYLLKEKKMDVRGLNRLINKEAGLLGVSGTSSDMQILLSEVRQNIHAAQAVELFCYQAAKFLGGLAAVLGGLDLLVFTGGIGENAPAVRSRICRDLDFLGIHLDEGLNKSNSAVISAETGRVKVRVMKTNEELMLARHTYELITGDTYELSARGRLPKK